MIKTHKNKILVVGGGGREHALSWKLAQSNHVEIVFVAPGNAGTAIEDKLINLDIEATEMKQLADFTQKESIDLVVVGPEDPLVAGIVDYLTTIGVKCFGPTSAAAQLEGSKIFAKEFMEKYKIPTATFTSFSNPNNAKISLQNTIYPIVIKADGLAAGKGVVIAENKHDAEKPLMNL